MNSPSENATDSGPSRDKILSAVGFASRVFLQSAHWRDPLNVALERLGEAAGANRAYYFENHLRSDGAILTSQLAEWVAPGTEPQIDNEDLQDCPYEEMGLMRWVEEMNVGNPIYGVVSSFPDAEREIFEAQDIQSLIAMPVFSQDRLVGFLGFDDCMSLREWSQSDIDALSAAASSIGAAIDRHQLEKQLRFSQKMEAIGSLASGVAHDFNNMLQAIVAFTHVIKIKIDEDSSAQSDLNEILGATARAHALTKQLLSFSRKQESHPERINLGDLCHSVVALVKPALGSGIHTSVDASGAAAMVFADAGLVSQVLLNVCLNARDAMPEGGTLEVTCDCVRIEDGQPNLYRNVGVGEFAVVKISDNGCGMSRDIRDRIFEPFFTTKKIGDGTGLGLSVAYGTIRQCGGYIDVTTKPNEGSQFAIYIPLAPSNTGDTETPVKSEGP